MSGEREAAVAALDEVEQRLLARREYAPDRGHPGPLERLCYEDAALIVREVRAAITSADEPADPSP